MKEQTIGIKQTLLIILAPLLLYAVTLIFAGIIFESAQPWTKRNIFAIVMFGIGFLFCLNSLFLFKRKEAKLFKDTYVFIVGAIGVLIGSAHFLSN